MQTIDINIGNLARKISIPEGWNDLNLKSLLLFYNTLFPAPGDEYVGSAFTMVKLISMAQHVLGLEMDHMAKWEADCNADAQVDPENGVTGEMIFLSELRDVLHNALSGLFSIETDENGATTYAVRYNLTKNPYPALTSTPVVKKGQRKPQKLQFLYAPGDGGNNFSIYELGMTFTLYENYLKTGDEAFADQLLAVLYRPSRPMTKLEGESGWQGDRRQPIRKYEAKIDDRAKLIRTLPVLTRRVLLFWFASCRQTIVDAYPKVFKPAKDSNKPGYGWGGVLLSIAGGPAGLDLIADQHFGNALTWLSMKEDEAVEMEERARR
jgi:hypothetical protein